MSELFKAIYKDAKPEAKKMLSKYTIINGEGALQRVISDPLVLETLPAHTPPFAQCWIEYGKSPEELARPAKSNAHLATAVFARDIRDDNQKTHDEPMVNEALEYLKRGGQGFGWALEMVHFLDSVPETSVRMGIGRTEVMLTDRGLIITSEEWQASKVCQSTITPELEPYIGQRLGANIVILDTLRERLDEMAKAALLVFGMLHCKNIILEAPERSQKAIKKAEKHNRPFFRYYTLRVTGKTITKGMNALHTKRNEENALHVCRGHFRTYTEEAPLFGKFTGTYWVDPHMRGGHSRVVMKDYKVDVNHE